MRRRPFHHERNDMSRQTRKERGAEPICAQYTRANESKPKTSPLHSVVVNVMKEERKAQLL